MWRLVGWSSDLRKDDPNKDLFDEGRRLLPVPGPWLKMPGGGASVGWEPLPLDDGIVLLDDGIDGAKDADPLDLSIPLSIPTIGIPMV